MAPKINMISKESGPTHFDISRAAKILVVRDDSAILTTLISRFLDIPDIQIYCITASVSACIQRISICLNSSGYSYSARENMMQRLHPISGNGIEPGLGLSTRDIEQLTQIQIDEIWDSDDFVIFNSVHSSPNYQKIVHRNETLLEIARTLSVPLLNYIRTDFTEKAFEDTHIHSFEETKRKAEACIGVINTEAALKIRVFRTPVLIGNNDRSVFFHFIKEIKHFLLWIQTREKCYFKNAPLRLFLRSKLTMLNVTFIESLVPDLLRNREALPDHGVFYIGHERLLELSQLPAILNSVFPNIRVKTTHSFKDLTLIDRMFNDKISLCAGILFKDIDSYPIKEVVGSLPSKDFEASEQMTKVCYSYLSRLSTDIAAKVELQNKIASRLIPAKFELSNGKIVNYYKTGSKNFILFNNTVGARIDLWKKLLPYFSPEHGTIVWECRGIRNSDYENQFKDIITEADRVQDIEDIFSSERIHKAHLVGFSSGSKDILSFYYANRERVRSLTFITTPFLFSHTKFSSTVRSMCKIVAEKPSLARFYVKFFYNSINYSFDTSNIYDIAEQIASKIGEDTQAILRITESLEYFVNYCKIYAEKSPGFPLYSSIEDMNDIHIPSLIISAQYDKMVDKNQTRLVLSKFKNAVHHEIKGASHWLPIENEHEIGPVIKSFIKNVR